VVRDPVVAVDLVLAALESADQTRVATAFTALAFGALAQEVPDSVGPAFSVTPIFKLLTANILTSKLPENSWSLLLLMGSW
jgi:hypothetical protein